MPPLVGFVGGVVFSLSKQSLWVDQAGLESEICLLLPPSLGIKLVWHHHQATPGF